MLMVVNRLDIVLIIPLMVQLGVIAYMLAIMVLPRQIMLLLVLGHYWEVIVAMVVVMGSVGGIVDSRFCLDIVSMVVPLVHRRIMRNVVSIVLVNLLHNGLLVMDSVGIMVALKDNLRFVSFFVMNNWHMIIMVDSVFNDDWLLVIGNCMAFDFAHRLLMMVNNFMMSSRVFNIM